MKKLLGLASLLMAGFLSGCGAAAFGVINLPTHTADVRVEKGVVFDRAHDQKLDIYMPPDASSAKPAPVVVFFYGGRWTTGERGQYAFAGTELAKAGFVVVIPDHRKYPDVKFPAFVEDAAAAIAWTAEKIAAYGGDPGKISVAGHSSGAHLAALVATDPQYLKVHGLERNVIRSVVGLAGPYAFTPEEKDLKDMFGPPERYPLMQVPTFVDGGQPPLLLLHGGDDDLVGAFNMQAVKAAVDEKGGVIETRLYPDVGHVTIMGELSWLARNRAPVLQDMTTFMRRHQ